MASKFQPTSDQLALSQERKAKKQEQNADVDDKGRIVSRTWIKLQEAKDINVVQRIKVLTWNVCSRFFSFTLRIEVDS
jgi:hypothetical protein